MKFLMHCWNLLIFFMIIKYTDATNSVCIGSISSPSPNCVKPTGAYECNSIGLIYQAGGTHCLYGIEFTFGYTAQYTLTCSSIGLIFDELSQQPNTPCIQPNNTIDCQAMKLDQYLFVAAYDDLQIYKRCLTELDCLQMGFIYSNENICQPPKNQDDCAKFGRNFKSNKCEDPTDCQDGIMFVSPRGGVKRCYSIEECYNDGFLVSSNACKPPTSNTDCYNDIKQMKKYFMDNSKLGYTNVMPNQCVEAYSCYKSHLVQNGFECAQPTHQSNCTQYGFTSFSSRCDTPLFGDDCSIFANDILLFDGDQYSNSYTHCVSKQWCTDNNFLISNLECITPILSKECSDINLYLYEKGNRLPNQCITKEECANQYLAVDEDESRCFEPTIENCEEINLLFIVPAASGDKMKKCITKDECLKLELGIVNDNNCVIPINENDCDIDYYFYNDEKTCVTEQKCLSLNFTPNINICEEITSSDDCINGNYLIFLQKNTVQSIKSNQCITEANCTNYNLFVIDDNCRAISSAEDCLQALNSDGDIFLAMNSIENIDYNNCISIEQCNNYGFIVQSQDEFDVCIKPTIEDKDQCPDGTYFNQVQEKCQTEAECIADSQLLVKEDNICRAIKTSEECNTLFGDSKIFLSASLSDNKANMCITKDECNDKGYIITTSSTTNYSSCIEAKASSDCGEEQYYAIESKKCLSEIECLDQNLVILNSTKECKKQVKLSLKPKIEKIKLPYLYQMVFEIKWDTYLELLLTQTEDYLKVNIEGVEQEKFIYSVYKTTETVNTTKEEEDENPEENRRVLEESIEEPSETEEKYYIKIEYDQGVEIDEESKISFNLLLPEENSENEYSYELLEEEGGEFASEIPLENDFIECGDNQFYNEDTKQCSTKIVTLVPYLQSTNDPLVTELKFDNEVSDSFYSAIQTDIMIDVSIENLLVQSDFTYSINKKSKKLFEIKLSYSHSITTKNRMLAEIKLSEMMKLDKSFILQSNKCDTILGIYEKLSQSQEKQIENQGNAMESGSQSMSQTSSIGSASGGAAAGKAAKISLIGNLIDLPKYININVPANVQNIYDSNSYDWLVELFPNKKVFSDNQKTQNKLPSKFQQYEVSLFYMNNYSVRTYVTFLIILIGVLFCFLFKYLKKQFTLQKVMKEEEMKQISASNNSCTKLSYWLLKALFFQLCWNFMDSQIIQNLSCVFYIISGIFYSTSSDSNIMLNFFICSFLLVLIVFYICHSIFRIHLAKKLQKDYDTQNDILKAQRDEQKHIKIEGINLINNEEKGNYIMQEGKQELLTQSSPVHQNQKNLQFTQYSHQTKMPLSLSYQDQKIRKIDAKTQQQRDNTLYGKLKAWYITDENDYFQQQYFLNQNSSLFSDFKQNGIWIKTYFLILDIIRLCLLIFIVMTFNSSPFTSMITLFSIQVIYTIFFIVLLPSSDWVNQIILSIIELCLSLGYCSLLLLAYYDYKEDFSNLTKRRKIGDIFVYCNLIIVYSGLALMVVALLPIFWSLMKKIYKAIKEEKNKPKIQVFPQNDKMQQEENEKKNIINLKEQEDEFKKCLIFLKKVDKMKDTDCKNKDNFDQQSNKQFISADVSIQNNSLEIKEFDQLDENKRSFHKHENVN